MPIHDVKLREREAATKLRKDNNTSYHGSPMTQQQRRETGAECPSKAQKPPERGVAEPQHEEVAGGGREASASS